MALAVTGASLAAAAPADEAAVESGHLDWGFKRRFWNYAVGPVAHGTVTGLDGAIVSGTAGAMGTDAGTTNIRFDDGAGTYDTATGAIDVTFTGGARFSGHDGELDLTFADPRIEIGSGSTSGTLYVDGTDSEGVVEEDLAVATLDLTGIVPGGSGTTVSYANVPTTLIDEGAGFLFGSFAPTYAAPNNAAAPLSFEFTFAEPEEPEEPEEPAEPGTTDTQQIVVTIPERDPGEFLWSIDGDGLVSLGTASDQGTYLQATGSIDPISITDTRIDGPAWSLSGQVSNFGAIDGKHLGWTPTVIEQGAGATAGSPVASGISGGNGLKSSSTLASATAGHVAGTGKVGADLDLRLPVDTEPSTYTATLTLTALS